MAEDREIKMKYEVTRVTTEFINLYDEDGPIENAAHAIDIAKQMLDDDWTIIDTEYEVDVEGGLIDGYR